MTELIRWVDDDATDAEEQLLAAAHVDAPQAGKREELLAALGVGSALAAGVVAGLGAGGGGVVATATTAAGTPIGKAIGAGVGSVGGAAIGSGAVGATAPLLGIVKWIGIGLVAGAVTSGSLAVLSGTKAPEQRLRRGEPQASSRRAATRGAAQFANCGSVGTARRRCESIRTEHRFPDSRRAGTRRARRRRRGRHARPRSPSRSLR
jgi:hypothetical protein